MLRAGRGWGKAGKWKSSLWAGHLTLQVASWCSELSENLTRSSPLELKSRQGLLPPVAVSPSPGGQLLTIH